MKIGIYTPYLDTVGGGERYMLTIAEAFSKESSVDIFLDTHLQTLQLDTIKNKIKKLLDINLLHVNFIKAPLGRKSSFFERRVFLKQYDFIFCLTDGSIFYSFAKNSVLHIQSPIQVFGNAFFRKNKLNSWKLVIYNSKFTRINCEKYWPIESKVIYPPVNIEALKPSKKKNQILTVGRFFGYLKDKKHEVMINSFKEMVDSGRIKNWSFHLVGGAGEGDTDYVDQLKEQAKGYEIFIHPNLAFEDLKKLYAESSIYWHASGLGEEDPTKMEHFGITTVEAMAAGCVPIVINKGGQTEIVNNSENGFLWNDPQEMREKTISLVENNDLLNKLSKAAQDKSQDFSKERFINQIHDIVKQYAVS